MDEEKALEFTQASAAVMELVFRSKGRFRNSEIECLTVVHDHTLGELRYFAPISRTDFLRETGLSQPSVTTALGRLLAAGVVIRFRTDGRGKRVNAGPPPFVYKIDLAAVRRLLHRDAA
ncbi:MarR family protein [Roseovarius sp. THAF27]|uniref:MarR family transcriptional regulator n=1 Tax=Roseovarius sp. THAF27 TaxID=2587850 RepID=UPI001267AB13|nr:MarR family transcriptional regulator [Roseovarius sp. THAF27]QFT80837.1 MarR family protein [Roseovarius sp. THAF27]